MKTLIITSLLVASCGGGYICDNGKQPGIIENRSKTSLSIGNLNYLTPFKCVGFKNDTEVCFINNNTIATEQEQTCSVWHQGGKYEE